MNTVHKSQEYTNTELVLTHNQIHQLTISQLLVYYL